MGLPFKEDNQLLPDNFPIQVAESRQRVKSNPALLSQYQHVIEDQQSQGIIEGVVEPTKGIAGEVHYLSHDEVKQLPDSEEAVLERQHFLKPSFKDSHGLNMQ